MLYRARSISFEKKKLGYCVFCTFTLLQDHLSYLRQSEGVVNDLSGSKQFAKICLSENLVLYGKSHETKTVQPQIRICQNRRVKHPFQLVTKITK